MAAVMERIEDDPDVQAARQRLDGLRRELFPALVAAYGAWRDSGAAGALLHYLTQHLRRGM